MKLLTAFLVGLVCFFTAAAHAATPTKTPLEVIVLGSGGPRPFGRASSSYIVKVDGLPRILVDAGPGAFLRIGELNLDVSTVDTVLLTHLHIDHSGDLAAFFNARALTSDSSITYRIFGPDGAGLFPKTSRFVDLLVGDGGAWAYQKTFGAPETFVVKDLAIDLDSKQTRILNDKGVSVVFSGDMDASALPNLVRLAKNADLLIFHCAVLDPPGSPKQLYELHTPPRKIGEAAKQSGVKSLLLSHTAPDVESREPKVRSSIRTNYAGPVAFATDKLRVKVGGI